ncbi:pyridoxamine 5'-phosphate oxidase family protein [Zoogloea dura]|jgi:adenylate cyclase|uniref:GAF domain-containing protein n=1 Tax=Zoogloea dura TaxID=2728840 RepID=A0A848GAT3_9RHOO|nr:pyridoxamine 5'-phosphate oxidase family protein [Zoogloea dura]NML28414.1 GAF domain-containing protein [Zoogloea dura]
MSTPLSLDRLRPCLEGIVPSGIATCGVDGMPNITYVSQLMYVDPEHVALSFQFFNKTRQNILANPVATVLMMDPETAARYRLTIRYLRTETAGPLFERMKAKLAGIASHEGMSGIFHLLGADVYRVQGIEALPGRELPPVQSGPALLPALRRSVDALSACQSLDGLIDGFCSSLERNFGIQHQMLLMADEPARRLYIVASRGYAHSGTGAEIPYGVGVIGVAARERVPIRIMYPSSDYAYSRMLRDQAASSELAERLETAIPLPGLPEPASQMAVPIMAGSRLVAVAYVESRQECHFGYDLEDALVALGASTGLAMAALLCAEASAEDAAEPARSLAVGVPSGEALRVRHFLRDGSVFLGDDYLIKGVAGAILWRLLSDHQRSGRREFSNRELRLDPALRLPEICDNLEARLILLQRRLQERSDCLRIEKTGRGRFRLDLARPVVLVPEEAA